MAFICKTISILYVLVFIFEIASCQTTTRVPNELPEQAKTQDELFRTLSKSKASVWVDTNKGNVFSSSFGSSNLEKNKQPLNEPSGHSKNMLLTLLIQPDSKQPITAVPPEGRDSNLKPVLLLLQQQNDMSAMLLEKQEKLEKMNVQLQQQVKNQHSLVVDLLEYIKLFLEVIKAPSSPSDKSFQENLEQIKQKLSSKMLNAREGPHSTSSSSTANAIVRAQNRNRKLTNLAPSIGIAPESTPYPQLNPGRQQNLQQTGQDNFIPRLEPVKDMQNNERLQPSRVSSISFDDDHPDKPTLLSNLVSKLSQTNAGPAITQITPNSPQTKQDNTINIPLTAQVVNREQNELDKPTLLSNPVSKLSQNNAGPAITQITPNSPQIKKDYTTYNPLTAQVVGREQNELAIRNSGQVLSANSGQIEAANNFRLGLGKTSNVMLPRRNKHIEINSDSEVNGMFLDKQALVP